MFLALSLLFAAEERDIMFLKTCPAVFSPFYGTCKLSIFITSKNVLFQLSSHSAASSTYEDTKLNEL